ncbi:MAG TPA: hypothetical protein VIV60_35175 [Polyangiaceae bacterium]
MASANYECYRLAVSLLGRAARRFAVPLALGAIACNSQWVSLGRAHQSSNASAGSGGTTSETLQGAGRPSTGGNPDTIANQGGNSAGSGGQTTLPPELTEPKFTNVRRVFATISGYADDNPTLTSDLRELYFSSKNRPGGKGNVDVWVAKRDNSGMDFGEPVAVAEVNTAGVDGSPAISADGLTLWVGAELQSGGLGGYDILRATRQSRAVAFGAPELVPELSSDKDDIPRPPGYQGLTMPLASRRDYSIYQTYLSTRDTLNTSFGTPTLVTELVVEGANLSDAFLTDDGLVIYFAHSVAERSDLFVSRRPSLELPFGAALPLTTINTEQDDRDPWLSPDGTMLFFSSDRDNPGTLSLYQATLVSNP